MRLQEVRKLVKKNKFILSPSSKKPLYKFYIDFKDKFNGLIYIFGEEKDSKKIHYFSAKDIYYIFSKINSKSQEILGIEDPINLIYQNLPIPPVTIRPSMKGDEWSNSYGESHLTQKLSDIVKWNNKLGEYMKLYDERMEVDNLIKKCTLSEKEEIQDKINKAKTMLQYHIYSYYDNESTDLPKSILRIGSSLASRSLTYRYKLGKQGRIRANLNGKRVNFSARTVITSDSDIATNEVGVPLNIAMIITYPERVTNYNEQIIKKYLMNGKYKYPGCNIVEVKKDNGSSMKFDVEYFDISKIKVGDIIHRHLINGDYILFNRQPSLHKMNMMCHKVSIISNTNLSKDELLSFRLNVSCTDPYNADFDGDEMNLHGCQSLGTKIELSLLVNVAKNFISPRNAQPIIALKQDSLIGLYLFTKNNNISYSYFQSQLLFSNINIHVEKKSHTAVDLIYYILPKDFNYNRSDVKIKNGYIYEGYLNKDHIGSKKKNILHFLSNLYGNETVINIMDNLHKLSNNFLRFIHGFTIGINDFHICKKLEQQLENERRSRIYEMEHLLLENVQKRKLVRICLYSELLFKSLDGIKIDQASTVRSNLDDSNNMYIMTFKSKSKGDLKNIGFTMTCLGQTAFNSELIPFSISNNRTLSYFSRYDYTPEAKGFIFNNYFHGLNIKEFFLHNLDGRVSS